MIKVVMQRLQYCVPHTLTRRYILGESMKIEVHEISPNEKELIQNLLQFYEYEFSIYEEDDVDESGDFEIADVDEYFEIREYTPLLVRVSGQPAGFVIVNSDPNAENGRYLIEEFFIMKRFQEKGVGREVAGQVFDMFGQDWVVRVISENLKGQSFWEKVIDSYTSGRFLTEVFNDESWEGPIYTFSKPPKI
ncbi:GNAT family N-acetyltransferase [Vibrio vulnificus]|nr:GNAT family N-acetyltransferase [Vibrio vulnificus]EHH2488989.1 GNAT family N-acetyltransferase [Vibrio vulnificus]